MNHTDNKRGILFNRKTQTGKGTSAANQASAAGKRAKQLTKQKRSSNNKAIPNPNLTHAQEHPTAVVWGVELLPTHQYGAAGGAFDGYGR